ncbi:MAG: tetratricopeptide repeat protein [Magnetococcales bacterium]|nr:tetratricopeptide repeat protein [Magnetococcales bacterium]
MPRNRSVNHRHTQWSSFKQSSIQKKAFSLYDSGKLSEALATAEQALARSKQNIALLNLSAICHKGLGHQEQAISIWQYLISINPCYSDAYYNMGNLLKTLKRFEEAEASYRQAAYVKPDHVDAYYNLGILLHDLERFEEAEKSYRQALLIRPDYSDVHNNLGNLLKELKRFEEAEASYRQAIHVKPSHAKAHYNLGILLKELKRFEEAEASYRQAVRIKPDYVDAYYNLGELLHGMERLDAAEDAYRNAIRIKPNHAKAYNNIGHVLRKLGRLKDAISSFQKALEIDKEDSLGSIFSLAALGREPLPPRVPRARLDTLYTKRAQIWDRGKSYYGAELVASALRNSCHSCIDILDAGCGTGKVGVLVRDLAKRLDGVDLSFSMLEKAREKDVYDHIEQDDLLTFMANHPNQYDAITCAATLIHFCDLSSIFIGLWTNRYESHAGLPNHAEFW